MTKPSAKKPDIYIAIPTSRDWKASFGLSFVSLAIHLTRLKHAGKITGFRYDNRQVSNLPKGRQVMLDNALASQCTHILFIDDDQGFTPDCFDLMMSRNLPYVGANICKKDGSGWIAGKGDGSKISSTGKSGVEQATTIGLGFTLINLDVVRDVPKPHFEMVWIPESQTYIGEDVYFAAKIAHFKGVRPYVDHDASQKVVHIGDYAYGAHDFISEENKISEAS